MQSQTITQTLNILVGNQNGNLATTGISLLTIIIAAIALITTSIFTWHFLAKHTKHTKLNFRTLGAIIFLSLATAALAFNLQTASAAPTLTLGANQTNLTITIPEGGGTAQSTTTLTTNTVNPDGYTLTANLSQPEPGISIKLKGGNITTSTDLTAGAPALTLKATDSASTNDTTEVILDFTIDGTVTPGTKELKLNYSITDNEAVVPPAPTTMQGMTTDYCQNHMTVYTGSNEEAVLELADNRGGIPRTYQVAKLADNNCWMLSNLKLGSTSGSTLLTPEDTNIASNFTLPQVVTTGTADYDNPGAYGPVPGDGMASFGVMTSSQYSTGGTWSLNITAPITATVGPFPHDVDGDTVATALQAAVGEVVTTNNSGRVENKYTTTFSWSSLSDAWNINIDLSNIVQADGPGLYDTNIASAQSYGYLYNWSAATAGESRTSHDQNAGNAPYSICPANWRLPTGGPSGEFSALDIAFGGTGRYAGSGEPNIALWGHEGLFKGVFSGAWDGEFVGQGDFGDLWSASAYPGNAGNAFVADFSSGVVFQVYYSDRLSGIGVRCLLN